MTVPSRRLALIGDPVDHSLSPRMHAAGFAALGIDGEYVLARVPAAEPGDVGRTMQRFAATGGGNVTLPHKLVAAQALERSTDAVRLTGACNCFWLEGDRLTGDNTDVAAVAGVVRELVGGRTPSDVLVLGAGGAGAAAAVAGAALGASRIRIANRTPVKATRLARRLAEFGLPATAERWPVAGTCDVVVNATSLGLEPADPLPASFDRITARAALDLVYGPPGAANDGNGGSRASGTRWTRAAEERGIPATDGIEVLLRQGAACYPHWFGVDPPLEALRRGLLGPR